MTRVALRIVAGLLVVGFPCAAAAQRVRGPVVETFVAGPSMTGWAWESVDAPPRRRQRSVEPGLLRSTAWSALLPGAGQHLLGQNRKWAYLAVEAVGWILYAERRSAGGDFRTQYRDLAWNQARVQTSARTDGAWPYYETLAKWERSGAFDADAMAAGVQPETDPTAYNGSIWLRATQLFLPGGSAVPQNDPQYQRALGYYREHAFGSEFLWAWTATGDAQDDYTGLIRQSDDRFRQATNVVGAILANHVLSAVDAYLSARGLATPSDVRLMPAYGPRGARWWASVSFGVSR